MKYKQWRVAAPNPEVQRQLEGDGLPPLLAAVLAARGDAKHANRLLRPEAETLHDPLTMQDMSRAAERVRQGLERQELIAVYGDYDVDGITATCLLTEFLTAQGGRVIPYIPHRMEEGYGLNQEAIAALAKQGVRLLITVDCGITAVEEVAFASTLGLDVIITDHHTCKEQLPPAVAVVDPQRPDCPYPFQGLAGVGVALKLALAIAEAARADEVFAALCDLAAVGTLADVMPMTGENRLIVSRGLSALQQPRRLGLIHLIHAAGLAGKPISTTAVGYLLAPRLNAAGRMGRAVAALELLQTQDPARAEELAQALCELNKNRQALEGEILCQCSQRLAAQPQAGAIVLADAGWHPGVVGIVASRLAEQHGCPVFMICLEQGRGKGSCRSWGGINLLELLLQCAHLLEGFGGHAQAAGFQVAEENIPALQCALAQAAQAHSHGEALPCALEIDAAVTPDQLTLSAVEALDRLEPCGAGNTRPVLLLQGAVVQAMSQVGQGRHLKLRLASQGSALEAIFFSADGSQMELSPGSRVDAAFFPQINEFRGKRCVQLQIADLRAAPCRTQVQSLIYDKFTRHEPISPEEARVLLPQRDEFAGLWRWLERHCAGAGALEESLPRIARGAARSFGGQDIPARTLLCLEVLEERGLIRLKKDPDRLCITLCKREGKVDLDASLILQRLRTAAGE